MRKITMVNRIFKKRPAGKKALPVIRPYGLCARNEYFSIMSRKNEGETKKKSGFKLRDTPPAPEATDEASSTQLSPADPIVSLDRLGDLPQSYGSDTIFLIAQEPHWLFTYWDIDISRHPGGKTFLRVYQEETTIEAEIEVPFETRNWYIPVKHAGSKYTVEIGYHRGSVWNVIARSYTIETPTDRLSESDQFNYATIPLHLSFQKLMEKIQDAIKSGETLMAALSRLQMEGKLFAPGALSGIPLEQRIVLEALLGSNFLEEVASGGLSSQEIEERVRKHLEERLTSQGAISSFSKEEWGAVESSLFSALGAVSSAGISSWSPAELSSWAAAVLSSWAAAGESSAAWSGESLSSWAERAPSSWGSAAISSWLKGAEVSWAQAAISSWLKGAEVSWVQAAISSWLKGAEVSWAQAAISSWLPGAQASWAQAAISSWLPGAQASWAQAAISSWLVGAQASWAQAALASWGSAAVTSWSQAAITSWAGASEWVSSFAVPRSFFMNVNAEVIFYGGTDPRAKVTIDGKHITLNPDGTFRYHFIFPDGVYEIPIVAISPDGVESRSAVLRFQRGTQKTGKVEDTAQPPLAPPMGSVP
jgi:hypothetical protein